MRRNDAPNFLVIGDNLSLDFVNTLIMENGEPKDLLKTSQDLITWAITVKLLDPSQAGKFGRNAGVKKTFLEALDFRRVLREIVGSVVERKTVKPAAIKSINSILHQGYGYYELLKTERGFEKRLRAEIQELQQLLIPIAESAADLLSYGNPVHLKKCESPTCILYFYDTTKNHRRRWCSMTACGNRAKAAAFYQRQRAKRKYSASQR